MHSLSCWTGEVGWETVSSSGPGEGLCEYPGSGSVGPGAVGSGPEDPRQPAVDLMVLWLFS